MKPRSIIFAVYILALSLLAYAVVSAQETQYLPIISVDGGTIPPLPTATPTLPATATPTATATQVVGVCPCEADTLNCTDFETQPDAQACFESCLNETGIDIHRLDANNDGAACESLPENWSMWR